MENWHIKERTKHTRIGWDRALPWVIIFSLNFRTTFQQCFCFAPVFPYNLFIVKICSAITVSSLGKKTWPSIGNVLQRQFGASNSYACHFCQRYLFVLFSPSFSNSIKKSLPSVWTWAHPNIPFIQDFSSSNFWTNLWLLMKERTYLVFLNCNTAKTY